MCSVLKRKARAGFQLHIELEEQHISVLHDVLFSFHAIEAFVSRRRNGTAFYEVAISHRFGLDEPSFEIGVDDTSGLGRGVTRMNGPGTSFLFTRGKISSQTQKMIGAPNQRADT